MYQKVIKFLAVICMTICLYVFIAFSTHEHWHQKNLHNEYKLSLQQVQSYQLDSQTQASLHPSDEVRLRDRTHYDIENSYENSSKELISKKQNINYELESKYGLSDVYVKCDFHLSMIFTITENTNTDKTNSKSLERKLQQSLLSIVKHSNNNRICVHIISDNESQFRAKTLIESIYEKNAGFEDNLKYYFHDIENANKNIEYLLPSLKLHFSYKPNSYYSHSLFFISLSLHTILRTIDKLILIDVDVQFNQNISELFSQFERFDKNAVIGIAHEQQPVYRHILHEFRKKMKNQTRFGSPPTEGMPGFNSGVLLMNLKNMRQSKLYNSLLNPLSIDRLCKKYAFRGHLGDQDFYTVVSFDYPQLFHVIPCYWNRQLCQWWRYHGYANVFDDYNRCDGNIKLFHGNCNAVMPSIS